MLEKKVEEGPCPLYKGVFDHLIVGRLNVQNRVTNQLVIRRTRTSEREVPRRNLKEIWNYDIASKEETVAKELHQEQPNGSHSDWLKKNQNNR